MPPLWRVRPRLRTSTRPPQKMRLFTFFTCYPSRTTDRPYPKKSSTFHILKTSWIPLRSLMPCVSRPLLQTLASTAFNAPLRPYPFARRPFYRLIHISTTPGRPPRPFSRHVTLLQKTLRSPSLEQAMPNMRRTIPYSILNNSKEALFSAHKRHSRASSWRPCPFYPLDALAWPSTLELFLYNIFTYISRKRTTFGETSSTLYSAINSQLTPPCFCRKENTALCPLDLRRTCNPGPLIYHLP